MDTCSVTINLTIEVLMYTYEQFVYKRIGEIEYLLPILLFCEDIGGLCGELYARTQARLHIQATNFFFSVQAQSD